MKVTFLIDTTPSMIIFEDKILEMQNNFLKQAKINNINFSSIESYYISKTDKKN